MIYSDVTLADNTESGTIFSKPEKPFLLHYEDSNGDGGWSWLGTKEELHAVIKEYKEHGLSICDVVEIGSIRKVKYEK